VEDRKAGHTSPLSGKSVPADLWQYGATGAQTHRIDELHFRWAGVSRSALRSLLRLTAGASQPIRQPRGARGPASWVQRDRPIPERPRRCLPSLYPVPSGVFPLGHIPEASALQAGWLFEVREGPDELQALLQLGAIPAGSSNSSTLESVWPAVFENLEGQHAMHLAVRLVSPTSSNVDPALRWLGWHPGFAS
jgi:hypothetical protein